MPVIALDVLVDPNDLASIYALYDRIQVWKSTTGDIGPYSEITAAAETPAAVVGTIIGPFNVTGLVLTMVINSADPLSVTFSGTNPLTLFQVMQALNALIPGMATESGLNTGKLKLTSPITGTGSSLQLSGTALAILGLSGTKMNGLGARPVLTNVTLDYKFRDFDGQSTDWYKTRYFNSVTGAVSDFGDPEQGNPQTVLPSNYMSAALIYLADVTGRPVVGRRVIFVPLNAMQLAPILPATIGYGILPGFDRVIAVTDQRGLAETLLVRGMQVRVFFEGSSYHRTITVPATDTFDLLSLLSTAPDPFSIVQAPPMPIRSS